METIRIKKLNEVYNKIECEPGIAYELNDYFTFDVPGAKFMPAVRNKVWDGKIRLFNLMSCTLYGGLNRYVEEFCKARKYEVEYETNFSSFEFSLIEAKKFVDSLQTTFKPRDYQLDAFVHAVRESRALLLSPTASGKSFIIYLLMRYYNAKTLIIVPTTTLVHQLAKDFEDYGYKSVGLHVSEQGSHSSSSSIDSDFNGKGIRSGVRDCEGSKRTCWTLGIHKIYSGQEKETDDQITITTWQSIYKQSKAWFEKYEVVIGDEAHLFKAKSLTSIMGKMETCKYRFGFTGTLDGTETHKLVLEGLFGPVRKVITTSELMEQKHVSDLRIKAIVLKYTDEIRKLMKDATYQDEMDYLVTNASRNRFLKNLTLSLEGNTLLLNQYVEKHGKVLHDLLKDCGRSVHFVHGGIG